MPRSTPEQRHLQARKAIATRWGDTETASTAGRDLRALQLEAHVRQVVAEAPPLTQEQIDRIAAALGRADRNTTAGRAA